MVKGVSRRVVVVEDPDTKLFEQAIFIVRNDAMGDGVTSQALVAEARRVARNYTEGEKVGRIRKWLKALAWSILGAAVIALAWLSVTLAG